MPFMLRSHVTGTFNGKLVDFHVNHSNLSASAAGSAVYRELTGKTLSRRRRDWSLSGSGPLLLSLRNGSAWDHLKIEIVGRADA